MGYKWSDWEETEGKTDYLKGKNVGWKTPPRLLWGTGDGFSGERESQEVVGFIEKSLDLWPLEDWHLQQKAYRRLVRWFFGQHRGPAWITTVPYKPMSNSVLTKLANNREDARYLGRVQYCRPTIELRSSENVDRDGYLKGVIADSGAHLCGFSLTDFFFAYGTSCKIDKDVRLYRELRKAELTFSGSDLVGDDFSYFLATPDDEAVIRKTGAVTLSRDYSNYAEGLYLSPHIRFCSLPGRPTGRLEESKDGIIQLVICLRPDGRMYRLKQSRRRVRAYLLQQEIDYGMLREVRASNV